MLNIFISISRGAFILASFYFFYSSIKLNNALFSGSYEDRAFYFNAQRVTVLLSHFIGFVILFLTQKNFLDLLILYSEEVLFFMVTWFIISKVYHKTNLLLWNIALYLTQIGFVILARLDFGVGVRQFRMALIGFAIALILPKLFYKMKFLSKLSWIYILLSFGLLFVVNDTINGAKNWLTLGGFSFQPSELVKILYILFIASFFRKEVHRFQLIVSGIVTAGLVMILVYQRDLGGALIFSVLFLTLVYIETNQPLIFLGGLASGSLAAFVGYKLFDHVRVRVEAWSNPWADIDRNGYQLAQSLFAIGAGGWIGTGLTKGLPSNIPVVLTDFIFSAISEEFGNIFSIFLIGFLVIFFLSSLKMSTYVEEKFPFMVSIGITIILAFQQILIIGGVTRFVPSTGVTLPFISYGGTSMIASCIMLGLLQGASYNVHDGERSAFSNEEDDRETTE
ncbi:MAG: FtsW/RodA/SpoVE family cell cycle protein [Vallitaleaceae bacterium]|nr:FtsW/RodA/SpoVE family cell cycle protein [Vallitaleaceae bacterium]